MDSLIRSRILEKLGVLEVEGGSVLEIGEGSALGAGSGGVQKTFDLLRVQAT